MNKKISFQIQQRFFFCIRISYKVIIDYTLHKSSGGYYYFAFFFLLVCVLALTNFGFSFQYFFFGLR